MVDLQKAQPFDSSKTVDVPEEIFAEIGCRLVLLQDLEMFLTFVAKVAFEKEPEIAKSAILKADKKTLGQLLNVLRKQVDVEKEFDKQLSRTLEARNVFVHEFSHVFNLRNEKGLKQAINFLSDSLDDLAEVLNIMKAVILSYGREKGLKDAELEEYWRQYGDLNKLESIYMPKATNVLNNKNA